MSRQVFDIFLSSTARDLAPHRAKVREIVERLEQSSICMETFGARPDTPLETCRARVEGADALVVIVGHRYGWVPSVEEGGDGETSITWWEVRWALQSPKPVPVYAYLIDESAAWTGGREQDRLCGAKSEEDAVEVFRAVRRLAEFRAFLEKETTRERFTSADDLGGKVATSLANWLRDTRENVASTRDNGRPEGESRTAQPPWTGSPFPGLRTFTPLDAPIFFGRDRETDFLMAKLCDTSCRFLLVVGASGSGKSSLVAAGLIPRLSDGAIPGSEDWLLPTAHRVGQGHVWVGLRLTPGARGGHPFHALSEQLTPMLGSEISSDELARQLQAEPGRAPAFLEQVLGGRPSPAEALLFLDQFEELVTAVLDEGLRARFTELLARLARSPRVRIVGTVRADFYHRCIEAQPVLAELLRERGATVPLAVPGASALRAMIEGPAARARLRFDDGLIDELVDETVTRPGGLALLAFALEELYKARLDAGRLSRAAFQALGGLAGAINTRAEATFVRLAPAVQERLGAVFSQLVMVDEHDVATGRRVPREQVVGASPDAAQLVDQFVDGRLLVSDAGGIIEVAHEVLLREWPRLARWIRERADDLRLMRQVEAAAREWERQRRAPLFAWPHERLAPVHDSLARLGRRDLEEPVRSFVSPEWERLVAELEQPATTHQRRAAIGDRLEQIGDARPGVGVRPDGPPDIVWCEIPGGQVELEGGAGRFEVAPFHMAKYPVTYGQYQVFTDDPEGYRHETPWKGLKRAAEPGEQYRPLSNHPADNVCWYDAVAFCRWLSARLRFEVRLPFEWEWQQAATSGRPENVYPWPGKWDRDRANTFGSRLGRTVAVGLYPHGSSAQGVLDLAGNVWEWCSNTYERPGAQASKPGTIWGLRGGSWLFFPDFARATCRLDLDPDLRSYLVGFRVVCVSPIR